MNSVIADCDIVVGKIVGMDWEYCGKCRKFYEDLKTHIQSHAKNTNSVTFQMYDQESMDLIDSISLTDSVTPADSITQPNRITQLNSVNQPDRVNQPKYKVFSNMYYEIFDCDAKSEQFNGNGNLKFHLVTPDSVRCLKCDKRFSNRSNMIRHFRTFH